MSQRKAGFFSVMSSNMNNLKKYDELCHSIGGIHRAIQLLEELVLCARYFTIADPYVPATCDMKILVRQFKQNDQGVFQCLMLGYRVWKDTHPTLNEELKKMDLYVVSDFLDWMDHKINHGVFVPENVYFQTMERIEDLRNGLNKKASV